MTASAAVGCSLGSWLARVGRCTTEEPLTCQIYSYPSLARYSPTERAFVVAVAESELSDTANDPAGFVRLAQRELLRPAVAVARWGLVHQSDLARYYLTHLKARADADGAPCTELTVARPLAFRAQHE